MSLYMTNKLLEIAWILWCNETIVSTCSHYRVIIDSSLVLTCRRHNTLGILSNSVLNVQGSQIEFHWTSSVFGLGATRLQQKCHAGVVTATGHVMFATKEMEEPRRYRPPVSKVLTYFVFAILLFIWMIQLRNRKTLHVRRVVDCQ